MAKVPFTSSGATAKFASLYALTDLELAVEAGLIRSSFRSWIQDNFTLDSAQLTYLAAMDNVYVDYIAASLALAVQNKLPVSLTLPTTLGVSKWIELANNLTTRLDPLAGISATGSLSFTLGYS